jgi:OOP family OmpA-OmpF porin
LVGVSACSGLSESFQYSSLIAKAESLRQPEGSFNEFLRQEYVDGCYLAKESAVDGDWHAAAFFALKAISAGQGNTPMPEDPDNWSIGDAGELITARIELVNTLLGGGRDVAAKEAASAQGRFDCWIDNAEGDHEGRETVKCRNEFWEALRQTQAVMRSAGIIPALATSGSGGGSDGKVPQ